MQKLKFLDNPDLQFILFGGKGGSGKSTSAAKRYWLSQLTLPIHWVTVLT